MSAALVSALSQTAVRERLCMTGEITLRGRVLPVGGIKEKILAGVARGLKHVAIPHQNVKDLEDVPKELLKRIAVHPVHHYDELLPLVFEDKGSRGGTSGTDKNRKNKEESKKETVAARPRKPAASGGGRKTGRPQPEAGA